MSSLESERDEPRYKSSHLPYLEIPDNSSDSESSSDSDDQVLTPSTPTTSVSTAFSNMGALSQHSDGTGSASVMSPTPTRRKYTKKFSSRFPKGVKTIFPSPVGSPTPTTKRSRIERPSSSIFEDVRFPAKSLVQTIKLRQGENMSTKQLNKPVGNQIFNLEILANIFSLFQCTDSNCSGRAILYKHILNDGLRRFTYSSAFDFTYALQNFQLLCQLVLLPKKSSIQRLLKRGQSQINTRSMVAVHSTSLSWADFRLLCSIMDLPVPAKTMPTNTLNRVAECSKRTALNSMKQAAIDVRSLEGAIESTISGVINCTVYFDASWHRRGHYSNQGFAGVIEADNGKVLEYVLYDRVLLSMLQMEPGEERK